MVQVGGVAGQEVEGGAGDGGGGGEDDGSVYREISVYHTMGIEADFAQGDPARNKMLSTTG